MALPSKLKPPRHDHSPLPASHALFRSGSPRLADLTQRKSRWTNIVHSAKRSADLPGREGGWWGEDVTRRGRRDERGRGEGGKGKEGAWTREDMRLAVKEVGRERRKKMSRKTEIIPLL